MRPQQQALERYGSGRVPATVLLAGLGVCLGPQLES